MAVCVKCNLDFEQLRMPVSVKTLSEIREISQSGFQKSFNLYCPACGERNELTLKPYGLFLRNGKFYRWRGAPANVETSGGVCRISLGKMMLVFPEDMKNDFLGDDNFSKEQICYRAVPIFRQLDGSLMPPTLPVKKDFLDLVDDKQAPQAQMTGNGQYRFTFHLHVMEQPVEIVLPGIPVHPEQPQATGEVPAFGGVHLVLWPKTAYRDWRRYFVRLGSQEDVNDLVHPTRDVRAWTYASADQDIKDWILLETTQPEERAHFACVESRPEWVAMEFEDKSRRGAIGGGIWRIKSADAPYPEIETTLGIDFGTSNTCIAWSAPGGTELLPLASCDDFIIKGSELPKILRYPDTWPPRQGFGRNRALLPTEILTQENITAYRSKGKKVEDWKPVVDYSIPSSGAESEFTEKDHVIADFKWQSMINDSWFRPQYMELQKKYLEFLLLLGLAELAAKNSIGATVDIRFSFPLAFDEEAQDNFVQVIKEAAAAVSRQTRITVKPELRPEGGKDIIPMDEARAAARFAAEPTSQYASCLYVDIGGGSTDIAFLELIKGRGSRKNRYAYICSFQYAGGGLASALEGAGCLKANSDISHFRRRIREAGSLNDLMNSDKLFASNKKKVITNKSAFFYAYLGQFLARLLAAYIINRRLEQSNNSSPEATEPASRETHRVLFYPLGNGWGFGGFVNTKFTERVFSDDLTNIANAIIEEAISLKIIPPDTPRIEVTGEAVENPKNAVSYGLLNDSGDESVERPDWPWQTIVGWTAQTNSGGVAEWYRPITGGNPKAPKGAQPIKDGSSIECVEGAWPSFPEDLPSPHEPEMGLKDINRDLARCSPSAYGQNWLVDSPFHVLLEKLFKPKLKELF